MAFIFTDELISKANYYINNADTTELINKIKENYGPYAKGQAYSQFGDKSPDQLIIGWIHGGNPNSELRQHGVWKEFNKMVNSARYDTQEKYIYRGTDYAAYLAPKVGDIIDYSDWVTSWSTKVTVAEGFTRGANPTTIFRIKGLLRALDIRKQNSYESEIVLSACKLKIVGVPESGVRRYYDCEIHEISPIKGPRTFVIIDDDEYANIITYRED